MEMEIEEGLREIAGENFKAKMEERNRRNRVNFLIRLRVVVLGINAGLCIQT